MKIGLTDPQGANLHRYYKDGELKSEGTASPRALARGITKNLEGFTPDYNLEINDDAAMKACRAHDQGGTIPGSPERHQRRRAEALARELGPGQRLTPSLACLSGRRSLPAMRVDLSLVLTGKDPVTILCDSASRYAGKMFNREFLASKSLPTPIGSIPHLPKDSRRSPAPRLHS